MNEEIAPVRSQEEEKDLELQARLSEQLENMTKTEGWEKIFSPWLRKYQKIFENGILNAKELKEFVAAQQRINLIDEIFNFVKNGIELGRGASERLNNDQSEPE